MQVMMRQAPLKQTLNLSAKVFADQKTGRVLRKVVASIQRLARNNNLRKQRTGRSSLFLQA
jgi:uncharacterized protein YwbE